MKFLNAPRSSRPLVSAIVSMIRIAIPLGIIALGALWVLNMKVTDKGSVRVTTTVPGADIYVDGVQTGSVSDTMLTGIGVGRQMITVRLPGFVSDPEVIIVEVTPDRIANASFVLKSAESASTTDSIPPLRQVRQEIFSTGEPVKRVPAANPRRNFVDYSESEESPADDWTPNDASPSETVQESSPRPVNSQQLRALTGTQISVASTPDGASVWVNNAETPNTTPHTFRGLDRGLYVFRVNKTGYKSKPDSITVSLSENDQNELVAFDLVPDKLLPKPVAKIETAPLAAGIKLDGKLAGTGKIQMELDFGKHQVEFVSVPGYATPQPTTFSLTPESPSAQITGTYDRISGNAFLAVVPGENVVPFDHSKLRVFVDGELIIDGPKEKFDVTLVGSLLPGARTVRIQYGDISEDILLNLSDGGVAEVTFRVESTFSKRKLRLRERLEIPLEKWQAKYKKSTVLSQS